MSEPIRPRGYPPDLSGAVLVPVVSTDPDRKYVPLLDEEDLP